MSPSKLLSLAMLMAPMCRLLPMRQLLLALGCLCLVPLLSCSESDAAARGNLTVETNDELRQEIESHINDALPSGEDGGPELLEVIELLRDIIGERHHYVDFSLLFIPDDALPDYADVRTMTYTQSAYEEVMEHPDVMAMIRDAVHRPRLQMSSLFIELDRAEEFPGQREIRRIADLLSANAREAAGESDFDEMLNALRAAHHLSQHLTRFPVVLSKLTGYGIQMLVLHECMHLSREHALPEIVLQELLALLQQPESPPDETGALITVEAKLLQTMFRPYYDDEGIAVQERRAELFSQANALRWQFSLGRPHFAEHFPEVPDEPWPRHLRNFSNWDELRGEIKRVKENLRQWSSLNDAERRKIRPLEELNISLRPMTLEMMILFFADALLSHQNILEIMNVRVAGAQLALAIELYRHRNGMYPESLDELVPDELDTLPLDPINEVNFGYRRTSNDQGDPDYLLYSFGANGIDNGGTPCGQTGVAWTGDDPDQPCDFFMQLDRQQQQQ